MLEPTDNVILHGVAHSGTSIIAEMLRFAGWNIPKFDANPRRETPWQVAYTKQEIVRAMTRSTANTLKRGKEMRKRFSAMRSPWLLKNPLLCFAVEAWIENLSAAGQSPVLFTVRRSPIEVMKSFERRGQTVRSRPGAYLHRADLWQQAVDETHGMWPWKRLTTTYEEVRQGVVVFNETSAHEHLACALRLPVDHQCDWTAIASLFDVTREDADNEHKGKQGVSTE